MTATPRTTQYDELDPHSMRRVIDELLARSSGGIDTSKFQVFDDFIMRARNFPNGSPDSGCPWIATIDKGAGAVMGGGIGDGNGWAKLSLPSTDGDFVAKIETDNILFQFAKGVTWEARIAVDGINGITTSFFGFSNALHFTLAGSYELLATDDVDNHSTGFVLDPLTAYKLAIDASDLSAVKYYANDTLVYTSDSDGTSEIANNFAGLRFHHSKASSIVGVQYMFIDYVLATQAARSTFQED